MPGLNSANRINELAGGRPHQDKQMDMLSPLVAPCSHRLPDNLFAHATDRSNGPKQIIASNLVVLLEIFVGVGGKFISGVGLRIGWTTSTPIHYQPAVINHLHQ